MGTEFSYLLERCRRDVKIIMVGMEGAGKTTITFRLRGKEEEPYSTGLVEVVQFKNVNFTVWDLGTQSPIRPYWSNYYPGTQGIIFVVDSENVDSLEEARSELHSLLGDERLQKASLLILANKQDLPGAAPRSYLTEQLDLQRVTNRKWNLFLCSAIGCEGLGDALEWLSNNVSE
ncbi:ADP-ribosylation factor 1 [Pelomyxa schiedti]|nr:ADP-ribosylation factor 1 [Pelomyxa schiedti]